MRIVICNERFLPRFGVDRVLLIICRHLATLGHDIALVCIRADREAIDPLSQRLWTISLPSGLSITQSETFAAEWLRSHWMDLIAGGEPELLISGGWPFFCVADVGLEKSVPSAFIDAGAVPHHGLPAAMLRVQQDLRRVRFLMIPRFAAIFPISKFIHDSQTVMERGNEHGIKTVLLGADHLEHPLFHSARPEISVQSALARIDLAIATGCQLILALGRYESAGYKNSPAIFEVFSHIIAVRPATKLLLLARQGEMLIPGHLESAVINLGFIDDPALHTVMQRSDLAISTSLWEGFNLPMAEMQWAGRPVLAFALGAHPELILDPWYLCASIQEMAYKAIRVLTSNALDEKLFQERVDTFRSTFTWERSLDIYVQSIEHLVTHFVVDAPVVHPPRHRRLILVDCTNTAGELEASGVGRVTRNLAAFLQDVDLNIVVFARWCTTRRAYIMLDRDDSRNLASCDGPKDYAHYICEVDESINDILEAVEKFTDLRPILLITEVVLDDQCPDRMVWARSRGFSVAAILYDLSLAASPPRGLSDLGCSEYLMMLTACDTISAVSHSSLAQFELFASRHNWVAPLERRVIPLAGQFRRYCRIQPADASLGLSAVALCIARIEPQKNHRMLIAGFRKLKVIDPEIDLRLVVIGGTVSGADDFTTWFDAQANEIELISQVDSITDEEVVGLFETASFTVHPSISGRSGLQILESLWMGCPCLCHNAGITAAHAIDGGCLTVDMSNPDEIAAGLQKMVRDREFFGNLMEQVRRRSIPSWEDYGQAVVAQWEAL